MEMMLIPISHDYPTYAHASCLKIPYKGVYKGFTKGVIGSHVCRVGQNHIYIRCVYGIFGREFTIYTVIYGVYIYNSGQPYTYVRLIGMKLPYTCSSSYPELITHNCCTHA